MNCSHCQQIVNQMHSRHQSSERDVLFEICSGCGNIWLDFGATRPKLHQAVEAQVERWEHHQHHLLEGFNHQDQVG